MQTLANIRGIFGLDLTSKRRLRRTVHVCNKEVKRTAVNRNQSTQAASMDIFRRGHRSSSPSLHAVFFNSGKIPLHAIASQRLIDVTVTGLLAHDLGCAYLSAIYSGRLVPPTKMNSLARDQKRKESLTDQIPEA
ncbi:hypothetical protein AVEN_72101-1 [Araneus ventricosus]|uniref:Uncharacterized protein n=1 Tax=Araneus ventricosus TaxID=182803 RepID=A0A4Y2SYC5_ARAVE|nr:hypothetical protein AVEN_72101-1 [Araneus ventricosus]